MPKPAKPRRVQLCKNRRITIFRTIGVDLIPPLVQSPVSLIGNLRPAHPYGYKIDRHPYYYDYWKNNAGRRPCHTNPQLIAILVIDFAALAAPAIITAAATADNTTILFILYALFVYFSFDFPQNLLAELSSKTISLTITVR